ncbi:VCBS domain-containing protein [Desulfomonile tiedjei]|uniref:VCBS repeat-containing protein n=1 Tax=Desulfomonile tiedjei (strain ATCC 49306 / DSM 6799 / DCB-1) TaxID=706587 RepID=I4C507_DESTA|nr:VCBS domain-containing protein [Desulfomonile tiedjei]AFM24648.1 VCBS repeat-containing protein [Desulfomonile tiedjei DSM 6799]
MKRQKEVSEAFDHSRGGLVLEVLEERIVLDGTVDKHLEASQDTDHVYSDQADTNQVDSLGWVYVNDGWWYNDDGEGWWYNQNTNWWWNETSDWWAQISGDITYWYHGEHQYWYSEASTGAWYWWDDVTDENWEPAFTWFADQVDSEWMWVYNDWNGSQYRVDDLHLLYQDHYGGQWWWFDAVNDDAWELYRTWFADNFGVQVFNDWNQSEYIWGNDFHYIQQHSSSLVNDAPTVMVPAEQTIQENSELSISSLYVYDVDSGNSDIEVTLSVNYGLLSITNDGSLDFQAGGGTLDSMMTFRATWSEINEALQTLVYNPTNDYIDSLTIVVNDLGNSGSGGSQSTSNSIQITVENVAPVPVGIMDNVTMDEGNSTLSIDLTTYFQDIVDDVLTYSYSEDGGAYVDILDPTNFTLTYGNNGAHNITIRATDGQAGSEALQSFTVNVTNLNPVFSGTIDNMTINEGTSTLPIDLTAYFSDVPADTLTYSYSIDGGTSQQITNPAQFSLTFDDNGSHNVVVTVSDGDGGTVDSNTFTVDVVNLNPVFSGIIDNMTVNEGTSTLPIDLTAYFSDVPADTLTYSYAIDGGTSQNIANPAQFSLSFDDNGSHSVIVTVSDGDGGTVDSNTFTVEVLNLNPVFLGIIDNMTVNEGTSTLPIDLTALFSDVPADTLIHSYSIDGGTSQQITTPDQFSLTFDDNGSHNVVITVSDGDGGTVDSNTFTVDVVNLNPVFSGIIDNMTIDEGTSTLPIDLTALFSDVPADTLIYSYSIDGGTSQQITTPDQFSLTFDDNGSHNVVITVSDGDGGTVDSNTFTVDVVNLNPVFSGIIDNMTIDEGTSTLPIDLTAYFSDVQADTLNYFYSLDGGDLQHIDNPTEFSLAFGDNGPHAVTISVHDDDGGFVASNIFIVAVNNLNPVSLQDINNITIDEGNSTPFINLTDYFTDVPADTLNYFYSLDGGDLQHIDNPTEFSLTFGDNGSHAVTISVHDDDGGFVASNIFIITVNNVNPVFTGHIEDMIITEGSSTVPLDLTAMFGDVPGDSLLYGYRIDGSDPIWIPDPTQFSLTFSDSGVHTIVAGARDEDGGLGITNTFTVTVENVPPMASDNTISLMEDSIYSFTIDDFGFSDSGPQDSLQYVQIVELPASGILLLGSDPVQVNSEISVVDIAAGLLTFTPDPTENGTGYANFVFKVSDGTEYSLDSYTMTIDVTPVNDPPTATDDSFFTDEDTPLSIPASGVLGNDSDIDSESLMAIVQEQPLNGTLTLNTDGSFTYIPNENFNGTDSFTYKANDGDLDSDTATVTITVNSINDAAVIAGDNQGAVIEDDTLTDSGTLTVEDVDSPEQFIAITDLEGTYGTFTLAENGAWIYSLDNTKVQHLYQGETVTESFTVNSADGTPHSVTITITGMDDAAVITGDDQGSVTEDGALTDTGTLTVEDVDGAAFVPLTNVTSNNGFGTFSISPEGVWTYTLDNSNPAIQSLAEGETITDSFTVISTDGAVETPHDVTITIIGTNDSAVITGDDSGSVTEDGTLTDTGTLTVSDVDGSAAFVPFTNATSHNGFGTVSFFNGVWTYVLNNSNPAVQGLAAGETLTDSFTVTSTDGIQVTTHVVTITITGTDDPAVIGGDDSGSVVEDGTLDDTGTLTVSDVDGAAFVESTNAISNNGFGTFSITTDGVWTYTLDNSNPAIHSLAEGQTITDSFTVISTDGAVETPHEVTVTITGSNDLAVIGGDDQGAVTEDDTLTDSGTLTIDDVDSPEQFVATNMQGDFGTFTLSENGIWTYSLDNTKVQDLHEGQTATDSFIVNSADGAGHTVTITITGVNDAAIITGDDQGSVTEDGGLTDTGTLTVEDVDNQEQFVAIAEFEGTYGTFSLEENGVWTYSLDNTLVQDLAQDETVTDTFSVNSADGTTHTVTITITGVNDDAVITGDDQGSVTEDGALTDTGTLTVEDVDSPEQFVAITEFEGTYGTFSLNTNGDWTYALDNTRVQHLYQNDIATDSFTVSSADGATHTVTITITGVNDDAVITGDNLGSVTEDGTLTDSGTLTVEDVDSNEQFVAITEFEGTYGTFSLDTSGNWTYFLDNTRVQDLAQGVTAVDSFTISSADGTSHSVIITITGVNDDAVITGDDQGFVTEDGTLTDSGTLTVEDVDSDEQFVAITEFEGTYGTFSLDENGAWTYSLDNSKVQHLDVDDTAIDSFTVNSADGTLHSVTITITGVNDAAVITGDNQGSVTEDGVLTDTGTLTVFDVDGDPEFDSLTNIEGTFGTFSLTVDGNWTYSLDNDKVQHLFQDETVTDSFTVSSVDGTPHSVTITITGTNDPAVFGGDDSGSVTEDNALTDSGTLTVSDADGAAFIPLANVISNNGFGTVTLTEDGLWTYTLDNSNSAIQSLAAGQTVTDSFIVTSTDGVIETPHTVTVTITGTNDPAVIAGDDSGSVTEDGALTDTGTFTVSDVDGTALFVPFTNVISNNGYGTVSFFDGVWTYALDNTNLAVQGLAAGETLTDTFTVTVTDGIQVTAHVVTITITGTNDPAVFGGDDSGSVTEDNALTDSGTLIDSDVDGAAFVPFTNVTSDNGFGTVSITTGGLWTYTLDNSNPAIQSLAEGQTLTDTFTVISTDGVAETPHSVTITITGTNDPAVIDGDDQGTVTEDGTLTDSGTLTVADIDSPEQFVAITDFAGTYGTFSLNTDGSWSYTLNNATVQHMDQDDTATDSFTVNSADGTSHNVTITITGANDAAEITGDDQGAVSEDGTLTDSGTLAVEDVDGPEQFIAITDFEGTYGTFTIDEDGAWAYSLDNSKVQDLYEGEIVTDSFTVKSADETPHTVTITITGLNDAATISGEDSGDVTEDDTLTDSGILAVEDVDSPEQFIAITDLEGIYGTFTLTEEGAWTYSLDNTKVQDLYEGETVTDSFTVNSVDGTPHNLTITITGANDAALISGDDQGSVSEDGTLTDSGSLILDDVDGPEQFVATNMQGDFGTFTLSENGIWTYSLDNTKVQDLHEGQTATDSFTVKSADETPHTVTITITGLNDAATISGEDSGDVTEDDTLTESGILAVEDVDSLGQFVAITDLEGTYGTFTLTEEGAWTYSLDNTKVQDLYGGETVTDSFTVNSVDGTPHNLTITITGVNDAAMIAGDDQGALSEDVTLIDSGTLNVSDVDGAEQFTAITDFEGTYGTFTLTEDGAWTYSLDNDAVQNLHQGQIVTDSFTVSSVDGTAHDVTIMIAGTNDPAVFGGDDSGTVTEDGTLTDTGTLTVFDVDGATFVPLTNVTSNNGFGTFRITADGVWEYTLNSSNPAIQSLAGGQTITDSFTVISTDGAVETPHSVIITITGTNDPVVIAGDDSGSVTEDGTLTDTGRLTVSDVDGSAAFIPFMNVTSDNGYGTVSFLNGVWTYTLNNANPAVQGLAAGETLTDTFTVIGTDGILLTPHQVTITIIGTDDPAVFGGDNSGSVIEDGSLADTGTLTVSDVDGAAFVPFTNVISNNGYGTVSLTPDGVWTYTLDNGNPAIQSLAEGRTLTDTFTVISTDGAVATPHDVTVTITGTNDPAEIGGDDSSSVTEDATSQVTGTLTVSDVDGADQFVAITEMQGTYGTFTIETDGDWIYTLNNATVQHLDQDDTATDSFIVSSADGTTHTVTITINGMNDAAMIDGDNQGSVTEDEISQDTGTLTVADVDGPEQFVAITNMEGTYGTFTVETDGDWIYTLNNATVQHLDQDDTATDSFTVSSADGTTHTVTITINGTNDLAVIDGDNQGSVTEDTIGQDTGTLTISDVDGPEQFVATTNMEGTYGTFSIETDGDWIYTLNNATVQHLDQDDTATDSFTVSSADGTTHTVTITINGTNDLAVIAGDDQGTLTEDGSLTDTGALTVSDVDSAEQFVAVTNVVGTYGTFSLNTDGTWTYTMDNDLVQGLSEGQPATESFDVSSADGTPHTVTITITGVNDAAVIDGEDQGALTEDATSPAIGTLTVSDVDGDAGFAVITDMVGTYGVFNLAENGSWAYSLDIAKVQDLYQGETVTDSFTVNSADGTPHSVTITITGMNDAALITGDDQGTLTEDSSLTDIGTLTVEDVDSAEQFVAVTNVTGTYGTFSLNTDGAWTYTMDNDKVQHLDQDDVATDTFTVNSADGTEHTVTITINGTNDAAVIAGEDRGALTEDATGPAIGTLTIADVDGDDEFIAITDVVRTYGTFSLNENGAWTYMLDNDRVQNLHQGQIATDSVTVSSADGTTHTVTITITGINDAAVIDGDDSGSVIEDGTLTDTGTLTVSDVDGTALFIPFTDVTSHNGYGTVSFSGGVWTYLLDNDNPVVQALPAGEPLIDTFTVTATDGTVITEYVVTITIMGTED